MGAGEWLGSQDSNLGMAGSKPAALPLGDSPPGKPVDYTGRRRGISLRASVKAVTR